MVLFVAVYAAVALAGAKYEPDRENFFDVQDSAALRGLFCIIVILVHVPVEYQNRIQDMMGSFAYIGVTFFFMTSAYGLQYGVMHKERYLHRFWLRRLSALLLPAVIANAIRMAAEGQASLAALLSIDGWVRVLLLFYFVFWVVNLCFERTESRVGVYIRDALLCLIIAGFSLTDRLTPYKITMIWPTESMGFAYGILLEDCAERFRDWSDRGWKTKTGLSFALGIVLGAAYLCLKTIDFWGDYCLKILLGFVLLLLLLLLTRKIRLGNRALLFLGKISYEVFLLQGVAFLLFSDLVKTDHSSVYIWGSVLVTVALAALVNRLCGVLLRRM